MLEHKCARFGGAMFAMVTRVPRFVRRLLSPSSNNLHVRPSKASPRPTDEAFRMPPP